MDVPVHVTGSPGQMTPSEEKGLPGRGVLCGLMDKISQISK